MIKPLHNCSFCGMSRVDRRFMHRGPNASICGECVAMCVETMALGAGFRRDPIDGQTVDANLIEINPKKETQS